MLEDRTLGSQGSRRAAQRSRRNGARRTAPAANIDAVESPSTHLPDFVITNLMMAAAALAPGEPIDPCNGEQGAVAVFRHLLEVCPGCRAQRRRLVARYRELMHEDLSRVIPEAEAAPGLWQGIADLPSQRRLERVRSDEDFHTWGFALFCVRRAAAEAVARPREAARMAELGLTVLHLLDRRYDPAWISDLAAFALAQLGAARRELGEMAAAADAVDAARAKLEEGTGSPMVEAEVLVQEALVRRDEGRLLEAASLLDRAAAIFTTRDEVEPAYDPHAAGVALLHEGWCLHHLGRHDEALAALDRAADLLDADGDGALALAAAPCSARAALALVLHTGRTWCLVRLARLDEAAVAAGMASGLARSLDDRGAELRLRLARLRIPSEGLPAEETLRAAAEGFFEAGLEIDGALALLELADHLLEAQAASDRIAPLGADMLPAFTSVEVGREEMAALLLFQEACREGRLTRELAQELAALLESLRRPSLAWWSGRGTVLGGEERR